jgi:hypothetical protein
VAQAFQETLSTNTHVFYFQVHGRLRGGYRSVLLQHQRFQSVRCNDVLIEHVCLESEKDMGGTWTFKSNFDIHRMTHYMEWMNRSLQLHQMIRTLMLAKHFKAGGALLQVKIGICMRQILSIRRH